MTFKNKTFQKFWKFSTSFQLGIPVLVSLTILIICGTLIESKYDAWTAQKLIYKSWMMYVTMGLLVYNLAIVMVDRLPWKKNHYPFLLVHIGIIVLIYGGWVTQKFGLDGNMSIPIHKSGNMVTVSQTDLSVYATFDGQNYTKIYDQEVDFYNQKISAEKPFVLNLNYSNDQEEIKVIKYVPYAQVKTEIVSSGDKNAGSAIKFQIFNTNMKQIDSLVQSNKNKVSEKTMGLLTLYLGYNYKVLNRKNPHANEIYFESIDDKKFSYALFSKDNEKVLKKGEVTLGEVIQTPWMGLQIRILDYQISAREKYIVTPKDYPNAMTTSAVQIKFKDTEEWLLLNDTVKLFAPQVAYIAAYHNRRIPLGFDVKLNEFKIEKYQGMSKAKQYSSHVAVQEDNKEVAFAHIMMNEPMKYKGFTFYQASFELDDNTGEPVASVLSVNQDPGRIIKYFGSIIMTLGIVWLFYQRRKRRTAL